MPIIASCFISIGIWQKRIVKGEGTRAREGLRGEEDSKKEVHMKKLAQSHGENNKTREGNYKKLVEEKKAINRQNRLEREEKPK